MIKRRYIHSSITADLKEKMVFIGGPRQVGKTTLARSLGERDYSDYTYLNWDRRDDRRAIIAEQFKAESKLLIFDELHKYKKWKNYLKGVFDTSNRKFHILATGSARLDLYRRGGDSLMGRYHYYRLHPFSLKEVLDIEPHIQEGKELQFSEVSSRVTQVFSQLLHFGGFPEPFLSTNEQTLRRFHNERVDRLIREDIRDLESLRDLSALQVLVELLPDKVGALLSVNSLREDLQVAHKTISLWMDILERFYYHFRIYPFASTRIKSLRKEPKLYLWDWSQVLKEGPRLENIVASHLLKLVHFLYDALGHKAELYFVRDREGHEVDFLVTIGKKPWFAVEVKQSDQQVSKSLRYIQERLHIPFLYQVVRTSGIDLLDKGVRVMSIDKFLTGLV